MINKGFTSYYNNIEKTSLENSSEEFFLSELPMRAIKSSDNERESTDEGLDFTKIENDTRKQSIIKGAANSLIIDSFLRQEQFLFLKSGNRLEFDNYYSKYNEYDGVIEGIFLDKNVFSASFHNCLTKEEFRADFDLGVFSQDEVMDLFIGTEFVLIVGQRRKLFLKTNGDIGETGNENFSKFVIKPKYRYSIKESKEIDETVKRWSKLLSI